MDDKDRVFKIGFLLLVGIFIWILQFTLFLGYLGKISLVFVGAFGYLVLFMVRDKKLKKEELEKILSLEK